LKELKYDVERQIKLQHVCKKPISIWLFDRVNFDPEVTEKCHYHADLFFSSFVFRRKYAG
jgi:hypothetical protein